MDSARRFSNCNTVPYMSISLDSILGNYIKWLGKLLNLFNTQVRNTELHNIVIYVNFVLNAGRVGIPPLYVKLCKLSCWTINLLLDCFKISLRLTGS